MTNETPAAHHLIIRNTGLWAWFWGRLALPAELRDGTFRFITEGERRGKLSHNLRIREAKSKGDQRTVLDGNTIEVYLQLGTSIQFNLDPTVKGLRCSRQRRIIRLDLDTDSNNDGEIEIDGTEAAEEEEDIEGRTPGKAIDLEDNVLAEIRTRVNVEGIATNSKLSLVATTGADRISVWASKEKTTQIEMPYNHPIDAGESSFYIEGLEAGEVQMNLVLKDRNDNIVFTDTVIITFQGRGLIDIDVDSDRNGIINAGDEHGEGDPVTYMGPRGALVLANFNYDGNLPDWKRDCEDEQVNGGDDLQDLGMISVWCGGLGNIEDIPEELSIILEVDNPEGDVAIDAQDKVRIFDGNQGDAMALIGPAPSPSRVVYKKSPGAGERDIAEIMGENKIFALEGLVFGSEIIIRISKLMGDVVESEDEARIMVSPFLVVSNIGRLSRSFVVRAEEVAPPGINTEDFVDTFSELMTAGNIPVTEVVGADYQIAGYPDIWVQDCMEIGYSRMPANVPNGYRDMHTMLDVGRFLGLGKLPRNLHNEPPGLRRIGLFNIVEFGLLTTGAEGGGNIECSPPNVRWPAGRVIIGSKMRDDFQDFFRSQRVQIDNDPDAPNGGLLQINTSWLAMGHVDEIISFCQINNQDRILIANPRLAMEAWRNAGDPWAEMADTKTIGEILTDNGHQQGDIVDDVWDMPIGEYNEAIWNDHIATLGNTIPGMVGMGNDSIVYIPVVFFPKPQGGGASSYIYPNRVNLFVRGPGEFVVPDLIDDPGTEDPLRNIVRQLLGNIPLESFVNSRPYIIRGGDIHCGTNAVRLGPEERGWSQ